MNRDKITFDYQASVLGHYCPQKDIVGYVISSEVTSQNFSIGASSVTVEADILK